MTLIQSQQKFRHTKGYKITMIVLLTVICIVSTVVCISLGSVKYSVAQVLDAMFHDDAEARLLIWNIRLPRVLCGGIVGICLSLSGCIVKAVSAKSPGKYMG